MFSADLSSAEVGRASEAGAYNLAQSEASCVVFGMPAQAIAIGAVHEVAHLSDIPSRLVSLLSGKTSAKTA